MCMCKTHGWLLTQGMRFPKPFEPSWRGDAVDRIAREKDGLSPLQMERAFWYLVAIMEG
ncbi:hypothetical protein KDH_01010 [Dictyobacter sp. S3.2.2.5]|uniref:Uncharacterized protein n=1 Tax=Dictyobacter halimunensis TaxID=3026934 RepID=A0ABQ6FLC2_9CHLR|nr:hypothetical protein KDH_01010 [Dictyobacter sp. S3.2.2.5]